MIFDLELYGITYGKGRRLSFLTRVHLTVEKIQVSIVVNGGTSVDITPESYPSGLHFPI